MTDTKTITLRPPLWLPIIVALLLGGFYVWGKNIEARDHTPPTISVSGQGKITATPDIAELSFGMDTGRQATAKGAMDTLQKSTNAVFEAVKKAGVPEKDIQHEQFSLSPDYDWTNGKQTLKGYRASQSLRVKVRDLDNVSKVLAAATDAGANQAGDVNFTIDDPEELKAQARVEAIQKAKDQARTLAAQLGRTLGTLKSFSEGGYSPPMPMMARGVATMDAAVEKSIPLPPGQQEVTVDVTMTYELK